MPAIGLSSRNVVAAFALVFGLCLAVPLRAAGGDVEKIEVAVKKKDLVKARTVALVSVYGDYKVRGRKVLETPGQYAPLETIAQEKTLLLKQALLHSQHLPFQFVDEGTVTHGEAYQSIIRERLAETVQPDAEDVVYEVARMFGSKAKSENEKRQAAGMTTVEFSREGYFVPEPLGVYAVPALDVRMRTWGAATAAREKLFRELGADAIFVAAVEFAAVGNGGNVFGKESGRVQATLKGALLLPDGSMPYTFYVHGVSSKRTLFRSPNAGIFDQQKEFVQDAAVEMSIEAWDAAWGALQTRMSDVAAKLQR